MHCEPIPTGDPNQRGWRSHRCRRCGFAFPPSPTPPLRKCSVTRRPASPPAATSRYRSQPCNRARRQRTAGNAIDIERHILTIPYHTHSRTIAAVSCFFNPHKSQSRRRALCPFFEQWYPLGLDLWMIEGSFDGAYEIPENPQTYRVAIDPDARLFHKETLLNLAFARLPDRYTHVLWIDADVIMLAPDYVDRLQQALDAHRVVQPFSELQYLGPNNEPQTGWRSGVGYRNAMLGTRDANPTQAYPGLAWAADRELLAQIGGLYDRCITGGGDVAWSAAVYANHDVPYARNWSQPLARDVDRYVRRVAPLVPSVGYVASRGVHLYHGSLRNRQYISRNAVLGEERYCPRLDVSYRPNGTLCWSLYASQRLRDRVRNYIQGRREDE